MAGDKVLAVGFRNDGERAQIFCCNHGIDIVLQLRPQHADEVFVVGEEEAGDAVLIFPKMPKKMGKIITGGDGSLLLKEMVKELLTELVEEAFLALIVGVKGRASHIRTVDNLLDGDGIVACAIELVEKGLENSLAGLCDPTVWFSHSGQFRQTVQKRTGQAVCFYPF